MKTFYKRGELATAIVVLSLGAIVLGTTLGVQQYNGRKSDPLQTSAQQMCTYTGIAQVLQEDGSPLVDTELRVRSRFTDNNGKTHDTSESFDSAGRIEKIRYEFDKERFHGVRAKLNLKEYSDRYKIIDTWCTEDGRDCESIGTEQIMSYIRCDSRVTYGWKLARIGQGNPQPPVGNNPTTPPSQPQPNLICSEAGAECYDPYPENCATGTRMCYKRGTCKARGGGEFCEWGLNSCCGPCTDPAGNDNNTCNNNRPPPNTPVPNPTRTAQTNTIAWSITNTAAENHGIAQIGIALYKNGQHQRDYMGNRGSITNIGDILSDLDPNAEYEIEPRAKKSDGVTNVATVIQEVSSCTNKDGTTAIISADKKSCTLKPGGSIVLLIKNAGPTPTIAASRGTITVNITLQGNIPNDRYIKMDRCDAQGCHNPTYFRNNDAFPYNNAPYGANTFSVSRFLYDIDGNRKEYKSALDFTNCQGQQTEGATSCTVQLSTPTMSRNLTILVPADPTATPDPCQCTLGEGEVKTCNAACSKYGTQGNTCSHSLFCQVTPDSEIVYQLSGKININNPDDVKIIHHIIEIENINTNEKGIYYNPNSLNDFRITQFHNPSEAKTYYIKRDNKYKFKAVIYFGTNLAKVSSSPIEIVAPANNIQLSVAIPRRAGGPQFTPYDVDFNGNGFVGVEDFFGALSNFGKTITVNGSQKRVTALYMSYIILQLGQPATK